MLLSLPVSSCFRKDIHIENGTTFVNHVILIQKRYLNKNKKLSPLLPFFRTEISIGTRLCCPHFPWYPVSDHTPILQNNKFYLLPYWKVTS